MDNHIILSICVSAYNRKDLTCEHVRKMLQYKGDDIEVIVSDNASEDGTFEALGQIEDRRLRIYRNQHNVGLDGNTIRMLTYASGQYVMTINDRDWVEPRDIQSFVRRYKDRECDFIIGTNSKELFESNASRMDGRIYLLLLFSHPGSWITKISILDELIINAKKREIEAYTEEWIADMFSLRVALSLYAKRWEGFRTIIRQPKPADLASVVQLRNRASNLAAYFTPETRMIFFKQHLANPYILDADMEMYIVGNYRRYVSGSLSRFYTIRKNPYLLARYHYEPAPFVCWIKIAIDFYREAIFAIKERGRYTHSLAVKLGVITIQEYVKLCKLRIVSRQT